MRVARVACGPRHMVLANEEGGVFTWGDNTFGALGHGTLDAVTTPRRVEALRGTPCTWVAAGMWHTAVAVRVGFIYPL